MAPGAKRIAFGGFALALIAWFAIDAWSPAAAPLAPEARDGAGLSPIPEVEARKPRARTPGPAPNPATALATASVPRAVLEAVLVGCFRGQREDGARITERYWPTADGVIEGEVTEVDRDGAPIFHETLRIALEGDTWRYHPAPDGVAAAVSFALVAHGPDALRFAEPAHDFPQVIAYQRRGPELATRVEGVEGGVAKADAYATLAEACP